MTATYQQLLKQSYLNRLRNKKVATGNDLLLQLDRISEDYNKEVNAEAPSKDLASTTEPSLVDHFDNMVITNTTLTDTVDFFDNLSEVEDLEPVD